MSRAARNAYNTTQSQTNNLIGQTQQNANSIAADAYSIPQNLTPQQQADYLRAALGTYDVSYNNAKEQAANFASRTGATAGEQNLETNLDRSLAQQKATAAGNAELNLANIPITRAQQQAALYGQAGQLTGQAGETSASTQNALAQQAFAPSPILGILQSGIQAAGSVAGGYLKNH
jgi:hypothetical protein